MSRISGARFSEEDDSGVGVEPTRWKVGIPVVRYEYYIVEAEDADEAEEKALRHRKDAGQVSSFGPAQIDYDDISREEIVSPT